MQYRIRIMRRWFIFCLDLIVVACAITLAYVLRFNFGFHILSVQNVQISIGVVVLTSAMAFLAFRNHIGIIRYTAMSDTLRLLQIATITSIALGVAGRIIGRTHHLFLPVSVVAIYFALSFFLLFGYRLLVRATLQKSAYMRGKVRFAKKAAIYGADQEAVVAGQVFRDSPAPAFRIAAFIDSGKANMRLLGMPVLSPDEKSLKGLAAQEVECILIPDHQSGGKELRDFLDLAFRCGIRKVRKLPPVQRWMDGKLEDDQLKEIRIEDLLERPPIQLNNKKIVDAIGGKRILVTGAAGSIGSELVRQLARLKPSCLVLVDIAESPLHELLLELADLKLNNSPIHPMIGDITDHVRMSTVFEEYKPEIVFHAAAYKHVPLMEENPSIAVLNNVIGTRNLVELSAEHGIETFVLVSTDKAVNPTNVMGASKRIAEIYMQSFAQEAARAKGAGKATKFITTRFGNVLGSNGSVIPRFKQQLAVGGPLTVTHPDINRFFMTIAEACQLVIEAGVMGEGGEIFVFDMGEPVKIVDLAERMIRLSGKEPGQDIKITFTGLRPGEKLYEEVLATSEETMSTYNKKILIAKVRSYKLEEILPLMDDLIHNAQLHHVVETVQLMKQLVPEFLSKNSQFEQLDLQAKKAFAADIVEDLQPARVGLLPHMPSPQIMYAVRPQAVSWREPEKELVAIVPMPVRHASSYMPTPPRESVSRERSYREEEIPQVRATSVINPRAEVRKEQSAPKPFIPVAEARNITPASEAPTLDEYVASLEESTPDVHHEQEAFGRPESPLLKARQPIVEAIASVASVPVQQQEMAPKMPANPFFTAPVKEEALPPVPNHTERVEEVYFNGYQNYQNGIALARIKAQGAVPQEQKEIPTSAPAVPVPPAVEVVMPPRIQLQEQPATPVEKSPYSRPVEEARPEPTAKLRNPFERIEREQPVVPAPQTAPARVEMQRPATAPQVAEKPVEEAKSAPYLTQTAREQWMSIPSTFEESQTPAKDKIAEYEQPGPEVARSMFVPDPLADLEQSAFEERPLSQELSELSNLAESLSHEEENGMPETVVKEDSIPDVRREMPKPQPQPVLPIIRTDEVIAAEDAPEPKRFQPPVYEPPAAPQRRPLPPPPVQNPSPRPPSYTPPVRENRSTGWPRGTR